MKSAAKFFLFTAAGALTGALAWGQGAAASVVAYRGDGSERLLVESTNDPNVYWVKLSGVHSKWDGKVIKTAKSDHTWGDAYTINYEKKTGLNKGPKEYQMVLVKGLTLANGSIVKVASVFYPESPGKELQLKQDSALSDSSQGANLAGEAAKNPFTPEFSK